jgi:hypothetical protein
MRTIMKGAKNVWGALIHRVSVRVRASTASTTARAPPTTTQQTPHMHPTGRHGGENLRWSCHNVATWGNKCKAIRREHLALGHLISKLAEMLGVTADHTDRTTKSEMQHLQVIKDWASNQHGVWTSTGTRRVRLFKQSATGAAAGLTDGQPKREKVWVPTDAFLPCMDQVSQIVAPWIVAGQGKGEFPEAFNHIGMHTDVV